MRAAGERGEGAGGAHLVELQTAGLLGLRALEQLREVGGAAVARLRANPLLLVAAGLVIAVPLRVVKVLLVLLLLLGLRLGLHVLGVGLRLLGILDLVRVHVRLGVAALGLRVATGRFRRLALILP